MAEPYSIKDKVVVVTGGASGIGEAMCVKFAAEGAVVVVVDMNLEAAKVCFAVFFLCFVNHHAAFDFL